MKSVDINEKVYFLSLVGSRINSMAKWTEVRNFGNLAHIVKTYWRFSDGFKCFNVSELYCIGYYEKRGESYILKRKFCLEEAERILKLSEI